MSLIGITGGIGSGKTFISRMFNSSEAFVVFNSDLFAKQILVENSEVIDFVKNKIGEKSYKERILKYIDSEDDVLSITAEQALIRLDSDDS